jgi:hypothetical protein
MTGGQLQACMSITMAVPSYGMWLCNSVMAVPLCWMICRHRRLQRLQSRW